METNGIQDTDAEERPRVSDEALVPELARLRAELQEDVSLEEWISHVGDIRLAIGYLRLFWPPLTAYQGGVFLSSGFSEEAFSEWKTVLGNDLPALERHMNQVALTDYFANPDYTEQISRLQLQFVGEQLQAIWQAKLAQEFPGQAFLVEFMRGESVEDYALTFYSMEK